MERTRITPEELKRHVEGIPNPGRRQDAERLTELMTDVTGAAPDLWGASILGFGNHHYRYATGREGDTPAVGFAARAAELVLYLNVDLDGEGELLERLGRHRRGKGCLYLRRLDDADEGALRELIARSYASADPAP